MKYAKFLSCALAGGFLTAHAHLKQGSLVPKGGESYAIGDTVVITWVQTQGHDGLYDIYLSKNGGTSWSEFATRWQGPKADGATVQYQWKVPANSASTQAVIRVCQLAGGECRDNNYILKSGNFTITEQSSALRLPAAAQAGRLDFDPATGGIEVGFVLDASAHVALQAFDAQGRLLASLLDEDRSAGAHALSLFSSALSEKHGTVVLRLAYGSAALTRSVVLP